MEILKEFGSPLDYTEMDLLRAMVGRLATAPYDFVAPISVIDDVEFLQIGLNRGGHC